MRLTRLLIIGAGLGYLAARPLRGRARSLRDRVVLITGGSRGLGLILARLLAKEGCRLAICARDEDELARARDELQRLGAVYARRCDITDAEQVREWVAKVAEHFGPIDIVINNAGVMTVGPVHSMTMADFDNAMKVNFWGALNVIWAVLPQMRERRAGQIVNIGSIGGPIAMPHLLPYDCSKAALRSLSEGLRAELARDGIAVTTVLPGLMRTGSPVHGEFRGDVSREFAWFSAGAMSRLTSMSAERAGQRIVRAIARGESEVVLTWQAKLGRLAHGLAPNMVAGMLRAVNRLLPTADGAAGVQEGKHLVSTVSMERIRRRLEHSVVQFNE